MLSCTRVACCSSEAVEKASPRHPFPAVEQSTYWAPKLKFGVVTWSFTARDRRWSPPYAYTPDPVLGSVMDMDDNGNVFVAWREADSLWVKTYTPGLGWPVLGSIFNSGTSSDPSCDLEGFGCHFTQATTAVSSGIDWFGTVRGRLGFLATPSTLLFATGEPEEDGAERGLHEPADHAELPADLQS